MTKILVDGVTTKIHRVAQEPRVPVCPSAIDLSHTHLRYLACQLALHRAETGAR